VCAIWCWAAPPTWSGWITRGRGHGPGAPPLVPPRLDRRGALAGHREQFSRWLDREHPIRWAWDTYAERTTRYAAMLDDPALAHLTRIRVQRTTEAAALLERLGSS